MTCPVESRLRRVRVAEFNRADGRSVPLPRLWLGEPLASGPEGTTEETSASPFSFTHKSELAAEQRLREWSPYFWGNSCIEGNRTRDLIKKPPPRWRWLSFLFIISNSSNLKPINTHGAPSSLLSLRNTFHPVHKVHGHHRQ